MALNTNPWRNIFPAYAAAYFFSYLLRNINAIISPDLVRAFGLLPGDLGLLTSAFLVGFALMQLPVGVALDRYGPHRVASTLLLVAGLGCFLFSRSVTFGELAFSRFLIGVGVSACLMSGYKAFAISFKHRERASVNSAIMAAGGLGALFGTLPVSGLLKIIDWRGLFVGMALSGWAIAFYLYISQRSRVDVKPENSQPIYSQFLEIFDVIRSRSFLRYMPLSAFMVGGFIAVQGLWSAYWLANVRGLDAEDVSFALMCLNVGLVFGYILISTILVRHRLFGDLSSILVVGSVLVLVSQLLIVVIDRHNNFLWFFYGISSALINVTYASHAACYRLAIQGRANTCLNLSIFIGGFLVQWGIGAAIEFGRTFSLQANVAFTWCWLLLIITQFCCLCWFLFAPRDGLARGESEGV